jgi:undecaprenyl-diphosphatase
MSGSMPTRARSSRLPRTRRITMTTTTSKTDSRQYGRIARRRSGPETSWNHSTKHFLWLNAPEHPSALALTLATFFAEQLIWAVPLLIGIGWLRGGEPPARRCSLLAHRIAGPAHQPDHRPGLVASPAFHDRPGSHPHPHVADSSFPSDALWWAVAFSLALQRGPRIAGVALALLGVPIAWARIYLECTSHSTCSGPSRSLRSVPG